MVSTYGIIYLVRDKTNGKVYIGRTTQALALRWAGHVHDSKRNVVTGLLGAIKRNGVDAFTVEELERHPDKGSLMLAERAAIVRYQATDPNIGYNIMAGNKEGGDAYTGLGKEGQVLQTHILRIRMTGRLHTELTQCAVAQGMTLSEWARKLLVSELERRQGVGGSTSTVTLPVGNIQLGGATSLPVGGSSSLGVDPSSSSGGGSSTLGGPLSVTTSSPMPSTDDLSWLDGVDFDVGG